MDDIALYQRLGEVIGELKGINTRLGEVVDKMDKQENRLGALEKDKAYYGGALKGMRWIATTAFTLAMALGVERIAVLFGMMRV